MDTTCIETRRALTAEPNSRNLDLLEHLSACESCAEYLQKLKKFDDKLKAACKVDVPEELESRIILAQRMENHSVDAETNVVPINKAKRTKGKGYYRWMSVAAALVLAVGLSLGMFKLGESHALQDEVLAHIGSHLSELEDDDNIQLASLNSLLQQHGLIANEGIGYIRHVQNCPIDGKMVPHLVIGDDQGNAVTVMYIPWKESVKRTLFNNEKFNGVLVGTQRGSFVIVSEDPNSLEPIEHRVLNSMEVKV